MNYNKIVLSDDNTQFYFEGKPIFKKFAEALKFHTPGLAPVKDESGWYHIDTEGNNI